MKCRRHQHRGDIHGARISQCWGILSPLTHISPAGSIKADSPAGRYLQGRGAERRDFNSDGSRRGNHEVMMSRTFANIRIRNEMVPGVEGGMTRHLPDSDVISIYDAACAISRKNAVGGDCRKEYGSGSSRDWAAKASSAWSSCGDADPLNVFTVQFDWRGHPAAGISTGGNA
ncbi:hypothetical protein ACNKHS_07565 [Shigella flexneri]